MKKDCYIIGGGPSLQGFDFSKLNGKDTIVVNKAVLNYPQAKYFITMDFTFLDKVSFSSQPCLGTKIFIANFTFDYIKEENGQIVDTRFGLVYELEKFDMIIKSREKMYFGENFFEFANGQNSAFCALQLAIILGYENIYLLGVDLTCENKTHFHGGYGQDVIKFKEKLNEYYRYFHKSLLLLKEETNINVYSCSKNSRLNNVIPYKMLGAEE